MREIKFRAWDKENKKMREVRSIIFADETCFLKNTGDENGLGDWFGFGDIELMQYTGLKDKNGKEIYEGDIIVFDTIIRKPSYVEYDNGSYILKGNYESCEHICNFNNTIYTIIGNIYENPDLINNIK